MSQNDIAARTDALEEAAKVCDEKAHVLTIMGFQDKAAAAQSCADAICRLKESSK